MRMNRATGLLALMLALLPRAAGAAPCRLALALAMDVSRSINAQDYRIQTEGLRAALADAGVQRAFLSGEGPVAMAVYEWSGQTYQSVIVEWSMIATAADLDRISDQISTHARPENRLPTALGEALRFGMALLARAPDCTRQVLDVAGDGRNNDGIRPSTAYDRNPPGDVVVNGLAIGEHEFNVADYYHAEVIRGAGAFVEMAATQADFPAAIRRKLLRELTDQVALSAQPHADRIPNVLGLAPRN